MVRHLVAYEEALRREVLLNIERLQVGRAPAAAAGQRAGGVLGARRWSREPPAAATPARGGPSCCNHALLPTPPPPTPLHCAQAGQLDDELELAAETAELRAALAAAPLYEVPATGAKVSLENAQVRGGACTKRIWGLRSGACWRAVGSEGLVVRRQQPSQPRLPLPLPPPNGAPPQLLLHTYVSRLPADQYTQLRPLYRTGAKGRALPRREAPANRPAPELGSPAACSCACRRARP